MNAHPSYCTNSNTNKSSNNTRPYSLELSKRTDQLNQPNRSNHHHSVLKQYKSCPVSPVSEEIYWGQLQYARNNAGITYSENKRYSCPVDSNYAKNFMVAIHKDTEKMIAEITQKYGDLDDYDPKSSVIGKSQTCDNFVTKGCDMPREHNFLSDDDSNFSSDSLEDCSLDLDVPKKNKKYTKTVCHKHNKTKQPRRCVSNYEISTDNNLPVVNYELIDTLDSNQFARKPKSFTLPKNMPSNLDMYDTDNYKSNMGSQESVQSDNNYLSDACNRNIRKGLETTSCYNLNDINYTNYQRYSSASFFLSRSKVCSTRSQESFLSDEFLSDNDDQYSKTNCNSLESILSDDVDGMKSAPLERLFGYNQKCKTDYQPQAKSFTDSSYLPSNRGFDCSGSKSYGSSPNTSYFEHYMTTKKRSDSEFRSIFSTNPGDGLLKFATDEAGSSDQYYEQERRRQNEDIPTLQSKSAQYNTVSRSLRKDYDDQKYKYMSEMEGCDIQKPQISRPKPIPKACCFEIHMNDSSRINKQPFTETHADNVNNIMSNLDTGTKSSKFFENLAKFEKSTKILERLAAKNAHREKCGKKYCENFHNNKKMDLNLTMDFVAHKPPKPVRRTSSVKGRTRTKYRAWDRYSYIPIEKVDKNKDTDEKADISEEKSFHVFVKERDLLENKSSTVEMDSLDYSSSNMKHDFCLDSLESDLNVPEKDNNCSPTKKNDVKQNVVQNVQEPETSYASGSSFNFVDSNITRVIEVDKQHKAKYINNDELIKFRDIERKIEIINKLVEMEERKLEQEKYLKEQRMRPIVVQKGQSLVKSISQNFEKLFSEQSTSTFPSKPKRSAEPEQSNKIKRNLSLPNVLAETKLTVSKPECKELEENIPDPKNLSVKSPDTFKGSILNHVDSMLDLFHR